MANKAVSPFIVFLMLSLITIWGSSFIVVKMALREGLTPISIATFRFLVAGAFFLLVILIKRGMNRDYKLHVERGAIRTLILLALTGVTFFFVAQYTGIQMAGASIAVILVCLLSPILISVLSAKLLKELLTRKQVLGIAVAAVGTSAVIAGGTLSFESSMSFFLGSLILLSTPFLWTTYSLLGKKIMEKHDAFLIVAYVNVLGGLCLVPFCWAENSLGLMLTMSLHSWLAILFLSITCSLLGYYIWFYVLKRTSAAVTSSFLFAEPLVTVPFAVMFVGETVNLAIIAGGLLILAGVYFVTGK
jgi:drug/metabolite transporter (DMT)-like permease